MARTARMNQEAPSERSRTLILRAALNLFSKRGYRATSMRVIARAAKVSTGNVLHCSVNYELYILDIRGGTVERLTPLEDYGEYNPSWSPDGRKIVHDVADANSHVLYITDIRTHSSSPLPGAEDGNDASWSPNGKWIVFDRRWSEGGANLYLLPSSGGTAKIVVSNAVNGTWSPDSQRLVLSVMVVFGRPAPGEAMRNRSRMPGMARPGRRTVCGLRTT